VNPNCIYTAGKSNLSLTNIILSVHGVFFGAYFTRGLLRNSVRVRPIVRKRRRKPRVSIFLFANFFVHILDVCPPPSRNRRFITRNYFPRYLFGEIAVHVRIIRRFFARSQGSTVPMFFTVRLRRE